MSNAEVRKLLEGIHLENIQFLTSALITDAYDTGNELLMVFTAGLPKESWTAEELLLTFETLPIFKILTEHRSSAQRAEAAIDIRNFLQECIEYELERSVPAHVALDDTAIQEVRERAELLLIKVLLTEHNVPPIQKLPVPLESLRVNLARLYNLMNIAIRERIQSRRSSLAAADETTSDLKRGILERELEQAERESILLSHCHHMRDEMGATSDPQFLAQEMFARLQVSDAKHAEELTKQFVFYISKLTGPDALSRPGATDSADDLDRREILIREAATTVYRLLLQHLDLKDDDV